MTSSPLGHMTNDNDSISSSVSSITNILVKIVLVYTGVNQQVAMTSPFPSGQVINIKRVITTKVTKMVNQCAPILSFSSDDVTTTWLLDKHL